MHQHTQEFLKTPTNPPPPLPEKEEEKTLNGCGCSFPLLEEAEYGGTTGKTKERVR